MAMSILDSLLDIAMAPFKARNSFIDYIFYDVAALDIEEKAYLSRFNDCEGHVILVHPTISGKGIEHFHSAERLLAERGAEFSAVAVAGVGSSILGTAALARNVADALGAPVAGIVSGYGMADLMAEGLGGWFFFGAIDRLKHHRESLAGTLALAGIAKAAADGTLDSGLERFNSLLDLIPLQSDAAALSVLLEAAPPNLRWLVGHSKGCLLIDFVLERYARRHPVASTPVYEQVAVVTLGAVVNPPPAFTRVIQVIGDHDRLGRANSAPGVHCHTIPGARHHLNPRIAGHLDVAAIIGGIQDGIAIEAVIEPAAGLTA